MGCGRGAASFPQARRLPGLAAPDAINPKFHSWLLTIEAKLSSSREGWEDPFGGTSRGAEAALRCCLPSETRKPGAGRAPGLIVTGNLGGGGCRQSSSRALGRRRGRSRQPVGRECGWLLTFDKLTQPSTTRHPVGEVINSRPGRPEDHYRSGLGRTKAEGHT